MLKFLTDENIDGDLIQGVLAQNPDVDILRVQDVGLLGAQDPTILAWAAEQGRILLTNDKKTIPDFVYKRLNQGLTTPGAMIFRPNIPLGTLITEILTIAEASKPEEWQNLVTYIPL